MCVCFNGSIIVLYFKQYVNKKVYKEPCLDLRP